MIALDLSSGTIHVDEVNEHLEQTFIGGWGLGCALAHDLIAPGIEPFSPENCMIISAGPFIGTSAPAANKVSAMAKSPIEASEDGRHFIGWGSGGSARFGRQLRKAGYDFIILKGKADHPSYVVIDDGSIELRDASALWGAMDCNESDRFLENEYPGAGTITIGRAGEQRVRYAMAMVDNKGTLGREGMGAVLGSKNIKAVVARGAKEIPVADPERFKRAARNLKKVGLGSDSVTAIHELGAHAGWQNWIEKFSTGVWSQAKWDSLYGVEKFKEVKGKSKPCQGCYVGCRESLVVRSGEYTGVEIPSTHYLCMAVFAQRLEIDDHRQGIKLVDLCNRAGICFFTTANIVDFVTRLYEKGQITTQDTGGLPLTRTFDTYLKLFTMIVNREGIGEILADGWYAASRWAGVDAVHEHPWVGIGKGMDPIVDARFCDLIPMVFAYIVNPRAHHGNVHNVQYGGNPIFEAERLREDLWEMGLRDDEAISRIFTPTPHAGDVNVGRMTRHVEDRGAIIQSLGLCDNFCASGWLPMTIIAECFSALTGRETAPEALKQAGERICTINKMLNVREGFSRVDDQVPAWLTPIDAPDGRAEARDYYHQKAITADDMDHIISDYYDERGWDQARGIPTKAKLTELGLADYALPQLPE
jgi:aldehyde:ferredoxin oxidoreductase